MVCLQQGSHIEETKFGFLGEFRSFPIRVLLVVFSRLSDGGLMRGLLDRYCCGYRLVPVGNWVVPLGQDRYLQAVWGCNQGAAFDSTWWLEQEEWG